MTLLTLQHAALERVFTVTVVQPGHYERQDPLLCDFLAAHQWAVCQS